MKYHYDVNGAEAIVRDLRVYDAGSLTIGQAVCAGPVATAANQGGVIAADEDVLSNIVGVMNETVVAASVTATGVDVYGKVIINPGAAYLARYSQLAADDVPCTGADATGKTVTVTQVLDHEGCWAYITNVGSSTDGYGNLFQVGATTGTTVLTAATDYDDNLEANANGDTVIVIHQPYGADVAGGSVNLASGGINVQGYTAAAAAGAGTVLEVYITSKDRPMEPLRASQHSGINYASEAPQFYADLMFPEHMLATGGTTCTRVIT